MRTVEEVARGTTAATAAHRDPTVQRWLDERQSLIVRLLKSARGMDESSDWIDQLTSLCETLVDYVSAGHFGIFPMMVPAKHEQSCPELAEVLRRIDQTTEAALRFNDQAFQLRDHADRREALSHLGLALEERFELEDLLATGQWMTAGQRATSPF